MKYRFRVSKKPIQKNTTPLPPVKRRRLRLRGADTLHTPRRLPEPVEQILFEFGDQDEASFRQRKRKPSRVLPFLRRCRVALAAGLSLILHRTKLLLNRVRRTPRHKTVHALPVLSGALCACLLVSALSAGGILLGLFGGYGRSYESVTVPDFVGKNPSSVLSEGETPFDLIIQYEINDTVAQGLVISQAPDAGVRRRLYHADDRCTVVLTVSKAREEYTLEELSGKSTRDASLVLRNEGLLPKIREEHSDTIPKGTVIDTLPVPGTALEEGDTVILRVSLGRQISLCSVPALFGVTEVRADALLRAASLRTGQVIYQSSSYPAGTVIGQSVPSGSSLESGAAVSYTVSAGNRFDIRTVPDLYGFTVPEAEAKLREFGLVIGSVYPVAGSAARGTVMTQSPLPGAPISSSTVAVDLYVIS